MVQFFFKCPGPVHDLALILGKQTAASGDSASTTVIYNISNKDCVIGTQGVHQLTMDKQTIHHEGTSHKKQKCAKMSPVLAHCTLYLYRIRIYIRVCNFSTFCLHKVA